MYDSIFKDFKGKLRTRWQREYQIDACYDNGSLKIRKIYEEELPILVNGYRPKIYNKTLIKEEFTKKNHSQHLNLIETNNAFNKD